MDNQSLINEFISIEAGLQTLLERSCKARKKLEGVYSRTSRKGSAAAKQHDRVISRRRSFIIKSINK